MWQKDKLIINLLLYGPVDSDLATLGSNPLVFSEYQSQTGVRSQGVFPYDGINLTIRLNKVNFDTYDFVFPSDNFKYLSSNTLYANNTTDVAALLAAARITMGPKLGTSVGRFLETSPTWWV